MSRYKHKQQIRSVYNAETGACDLDSLHNDIFPASATLAGDCTMLVTLLIGLQSKWSDARRYRMWRVMWTQVSSGDAVSNACDKWLRGRDFSTFCLQLRWRYH